MIDAHAQPGIGGGTLSGVPVSASTSGAATAADLDAVADLLGRVPRGVVGIAHRCRCGRPDVVETSPRLPDGTPFPTTYYLVDPFAASAISTQEASGLMRRMQDRLATDPELATAYAAAHEDYLSRRARLGRVEEIEGISAGGMPTRVKCLHALVGHALAAGPGVQPFGDEALAELAAAGGWPATCPHGELDGSGGSAEPDGSAVDLPAGPVAPVARPESEADAAP